MLFSVSTEYNTIMTLLLLFFFPGRTTAAAAATLPRERTHVALTGGSRGTTTNAYYLPLLSISLGSLSDVRSSAHIIRRWQYGFHIKGYCIPADYCPSRRHNIVTHTHAQCIVTHILCPNTIRIGRCTSVNNIMNEGRSRSSIAFERRCTVDVCLLGKIKCQTRLRHDIIIYYYNVF